MNVNIFSNGRIIKDLEGLRNNFNIADIYGYYKNGKLVEWLRHRNYEREYIRIQQIKEKDRNVICGKLCQIFGVKESIVPSQERQSLIDNKKVIVSEDNKIATLEMDVKRLNETVDELNKKIAKLAMQLNSVRYGLWKHGRFFEKDRY
ncbi:MAG: hypothetical protein MJ050_01345 [Phascolarctobacterium sp.]|nr:hypothetical protein [Phascolarctobacterium sp.]